MFKKIGKYLLSAALVFTSVFAVAGCGKDDDNKDDPTAISSEDWKNGINYELFSIRTVVDVTPEDTLVGGYEINFDFYKGYEFNYNNIFYPDSEGGGSVPNVSYLTPGTEKFTYKYNESTMSWYWEHELDVQEEYDANISAIREIIWKVKNGQNLFTKVDNASTYKMNVSGSALESYVTTMKEVMGVTAFSIDTVVVSRNDYNEYTVALNSNSGDTIIMISFHDVSAIDWVVGNEINLYSSEFKLVNNSGDINQIILEVDSTGFHVVLAPEKGGEEYFKDNGDGTYTQYLKNGESFTSHNYNNDEAYRAEYKAYVTAHTFDWSSLSLGNFQIVDGKYFYSHDVDVTDTGTRYEYYFSNIVIDPEGRTATWDYKVHDKALNQDSPVYPIVVTPVYTDITYPTVG